MKNHFGPWATPINAGMNPQLSSFWRRRMSLLASVSQTRIALSRGNRLWLCTWAILMIALPTVRAISAVAEEHPPAKTPAKATSDGTPEKDNPVSATESSEKPVRSDQGKTQEENSAAAQAAERAYKATYAEYETGRTDIEAVYRWSIRWMRAEQAVQGDVAIRLHLERMERLRDQAKALNDTGARGGEAATLAAAQYYVVEAKEMLEKEKEKTSPPDHGRTQADKAKQDALNWLADHQTTGKEKAEQSLDEFKRLYALKANESLNRIAPPFVPGRLEYYRRTNPSQAELISRGPDVMCLRWRDGNIKNWSMTFGTMDLSSVLNNLANIYPQEIQGDADLLKTPITGDWVLRVGTPEAEVYRRLEAILANECNLPVKLYVVAEQRSAWVAAGSFHVEPTNNESGEFSPCVKIYGKKLSHDAHGGGSGDFEKFLKHLGQFIGDRVVSKVEKPPEDFVWFFHGDYFPTKAEEIDDRDPATVLKNITEQTGLKFYKQMSIVRVLHVKRAK
jgi:hypothetical protein